MLQISQTSAQLVGDFNWISLQHRVWGGTAAKGPWVLTSSCNVELQQQKKISLVLEP